MTEPQAAPRRKGKPWIIAVPLILVVMLGACWCGLWFYAASRAEREVEAWIAREFMLGRAWSCAERSLGGFPFRFEILCREPTLLTRGGDPLRITAANAHLVAQVWAPNHIVAEFASPAKVEDTAGGRVFHASWTLLQMSGIGDMSGRAQRFSLATDQLSLQLAPATAAPTTLFTAKHFEAHARRRPAASSAGPDGVDFAVGLVDGDNPAIAAAGATGPVNLTLQGSISSIEDLRPMSVQDRIRAWAQANGNLRVDVFQVTTPKAALSASGAVLVDQQGRLNGAVNIGFAGQDELLKNLARSGLIAPELAPVMSALALAGKPGDVAGRKGATFSLMLKEGTLQLGKFPVGIIPPLF